MLMRFFCMSFALGFIAVVERAHRAGSTRSSLAGGLLATALMVLTLAPVSTEAAERLEHGTTVRATSHGIEGGWHEGTLVRIANRCWMIQLRKPTKDGYTMIALMTVARLQVASQGQWRDASTEPNMADQPPACREEGSD